MEITPLDITQKSFGRALRGFDREEVEAFLALVASEFEGLVREVQTLRADARRKDEDIAELRSRERALQETMITAQKACEKIVQGAHQRYLRVVDDIHEMKRQRAQFESGVRAIVEGHLKLLETFEDAGAERGIEYLPSKKKAAEEK